MSTTHAFRLKPGQDLKREIEIYVKENGIDAGWIACCAGSLTAYHLRFANRSEGVSASGHFEIVSATGTVSQHGSHLHISVSDGEGRTVGGHLLEGNIIYTTAEIIICEAEGLIFTRAMDGTTPWAELQIRQG